MVPKLIFFLVTLFVLKSKNFAQPSNNISPGVSFLIPASLPDSNKTVGSGIHIKAEHFFSRRISGIIKIGYLLFKGKVATWDNKEEHKFAMIPVMAGARFYIKNFYLGSAFGIAIQANKNTGTNFVLSPALGYRSRHLDVEVHLLGVPQAFPSFPENTYFKKGGYSYLGLQVDYVFYK